MTSTEMSRPETPPHGTPARFCVKRKTYRGLNGWLVYTIPHKCDRPLCFERLTVTRFFCRTEVEARRMAGECRRGLAPLFDFQIAERIAKGQQDLLIAAGYQVLGVC